MPRAQTISAAQRLVLPNRMRFSLYTEPLTGREWILAQPLSRLRPHSTYSVAHAFSHSRYSAPISCRLFHSRHCALPCDSYAETVDAFNDFDIAEIAITVPKGAGDSAVEHWNVV